MVDFCEKCGAIVIGKIGNEIKCVSCGKKNKVEKPLLVERNIKKKKEIIFERIDSSIIHPITNEIECPKCKKKNARFWSKQTRSSDEPETQFFKCIECSNQWRIFG